MSSKRRDSDFLVKEIDRLNLLRTELEKQIIKEKELKKNYL